MLQFLHSALPAIANQNANLQLSFRAGVHPWGEALGSTFLWLFRMRDLVMRFRLNYPISLGHLLIPKTCSKEMKLISCDQTTVRGRILHGLVADDGSISSWDEKSRVFQTSCPRGFCPEPSLFRSLSYEFVQSSGSVDQFRVS